MADEYLAHMALDVAEHLKLGTAASTDMIAISFSTLDKVGHDFGPHSHEIQDVLIRLDRTLFTEEHHAFRLTVYPSIRSPTFRTERRAPRTALSGSV